MPRPDSNPWTPKQLAQLREMRNSGCSFEEIEHTVNHPALSCRNKAYTSGIFPPAHMQRGGCRKVDMRLNPSRRQSGRHLTERPCLNCRTPFYSEGAHHRLCKNCRRQDNDTVFTTPAMVMR